MKKWNIKSKFKIKSFDKTQDKSEKLKIDKIIDDLLKNRGIETKKEREEFLNPKLEDVTIKSVGIDKKQLKKALDRIKKAIEKKEQIVVFGDYDVDGICGTAILWETLYGLGAKVLPYIPHRMDEGYGLSKTGISNLLAKRDPASQDKSQISNTKLIITVDNGIVANKAVDFAKKQGIDVIITDHHVVSKKLPKAYAIVHTTKLSGTGVAYMLAREIENSKSKVENSNGKWEMENGRLELVALATVADLVPLTSVNRTLLKFGLNSLRNTKRVGLLALLKEAVIDPSSIGTYEIGHIIAPRLNAMGRLEYAMDSLRLLCTNNKQKAQDLAFKLSSTNRERQLLTEEIRIHAVSAVKNQSKMGKLLFISNKTYQQGVIGLVAGKLVEEFYRPSIVVSIGEIHSKASARSVAGFNIIEFIRTASDHLVDAGGHPMAAGFTVETAKLSLLQKTLEELAHKLVRKDLLTRTLRVDMELPFPCIDTSLHRAIQSLAPFGMGNPEPTFVSKDVIIDDMRFVGRDNKHLKFKLKSQNSNLKTQTIDGIAFGIGERASEFKIGDAVDIVYTIDMNKWNGNTTLQLKVKDIVRS